MIAIISEGFDTFISEPGRFDVGEIHRRIFPTPFGQVYYYEFDYLSEQVIYFGHSGMTAENDISSAVLSVFYAAKELGIRQFIYFSKVGGINLDYRVGDIVLPDDYIDFTTRRPRSFYQALDPAYTLHYEMTNPLCSAVQQNIATSLQNLPVMQQQYAGGIHVSGTYVCTEGPGFESRAEIEMFRGSGADIVGHTLCPAVYYARELKLCLSAVCLVSNICVGKRTYSAGPQFFPRDEGTRDLMSEMILAVLTSLRSAVCEHQGGFLREPNKRDKYGAFT